MLSFRLRRNRLSRVAGALDMRVLISAFACLPDRGSEPGVGWEWPKALAQISDHDVTVVTQIANRAAIEEYLSHHSMPRITFHYIPFDNRLRQSGTIAHYLFYYLWQCMLLINLLKTGQWRHYDLLHHLTYGGIRTWTLLWVLPRPLIVGPVGGGETAPVRLSRKLGKHSAMRERIRTILNLLNRFDPVLIAMQLNANRLLAKTPASARMFIFGQSKTAVSVEIGAPRAPVAQPEKTQGAPFRVLFAARLIYWKGADFVVDAMKLLDGDDVPMELVIVGGGERELSLAEKIAGFRHIKATLTGKIPQHALFNAYRQADLFVFPSLHDSSGNVVLEAMTFGLPVICFDLGGPPIIAGDAAIAVNVDDADHEEACRRLAAAIRGLRDDPGHRARLAQAALRRAETLSWEHAVRAGYGPWLRTDMVPSNPEHSAEAMQP